MEAAGGVGVEGGVEGGADARGDVRLVDASTSMPQAHRDEHDGRRRDESMPQEWQHSMPSSAARKAAPPVVPAQHQVLALDSCQAEACLRCER